MNIPSAKPVRNQAGNRRSAKLSLCFNQRYPHSAAGGGNRGSTSGRAAAADDNIIRHKR